MPRRISVNNRKSIKINSNECLHKDSIKMLMNEKMPDFIERLLYQIYNECSNKDLEHIINHIDRTKKIKGDNRNMEMKLFLESYIEEKYDEMKRLALIFNREEEDRTNRTHLRKRKQILSNFYKLESIFCLSTITMNIKGGGFIIATKPLPEIDE